MTDEQITALIGRTAGEAARESREQFEVVVESLRTEIQQVAEGHDQIIRGIGQLIHEVRELTAPRRRFRGAACGTPFDR